MIQNVAQMLEIFFSNVFLCECLACISVNVFVSTSQNKSQFMIYYFCFTCDFGWWRIIFFTSVQSVRDFSYFNKCYSLIASYFLLNIFHVQFILFYDFFYSEHDYKDAS